LEILELQANVVSFWSYYELQLLYFAKISGGWWEFIIPVGSLCGEIGQEEKLSKRSTKSKEIQLLLSLSLPHLLRKKKIFQRNLGQEKGCFQPSHFCNS
jgi:hypothetical protein